MYGSILEINGGDGLDGKSDRGNGEEWTDLRDVLGAERMESACGVDTGERKTEIKGVF